VSLGAVIIEKHFTLDNNLPGPDHFLSLNPKKFKEMSIGIRSINKAKGNYEKVPTKQEVPNIFPGRRSIMAGCDIKKGEKISLSKLKIIKPAKGIAPKFLDFVVGRKAKKNIKKYQPITWESI
jgi:N-acetylneuraminate synthase/N,N'-diacetyllegionaminate synthase